MAVGVLPLKQLSKSVANIIKERAQFVNWCSMNLGKLANIPRSIAIAIELGANLLDECDIYVFHMRHFTFEYVRQSTEKLFSQKSHYSRRKTGSKPFHPKIGIANRTAKCSIETFIANRGRIRVPNDYRGSIFYRKITRGMIAWQQ